MRRSRRRSIYTVIAEGVLCAALVFAPLALGSAPEWVLPVLSALVLAAAVLALIGAARQHERLTLPFLAVVPGLSAALCLLQLIPLPPLLLGLASAPAAELREFALVPLGLTSWRPVSLDAPATWRELVKSLVYLAGMLTASQLARSRHARRRMLMAVAGAGTLVALIGLGHKLMAASTLFGAYAYSSEPPLLTTFGNPNHLAGYLTLSGTVTLGLAFSTLDRSRALLWGGAFLATGLAAFLSLSRGGIAFFVFGQLLLGVLYWRTRQAGAEGPRPFFGLSSTVLVAVLAVFAVAGYVAFERLLEELGTADSVAELRQSKVELYPSVVRMSLDFPILGVGRGAFEIGYPRFQEKYPEHTFTHPENVVLQLASELGILPALALLGLLLWGVLRLLRREQLGTAEQAAVVAVLAVGAHDLFDFSLELPACALSACVLLGLASVRVGNADAVTDPGQRSSRRALRVRWAAGLSGVVALAGVGLLLSRATLRRAQEQVAASVGANRPIEALRAETLHLIQEHPADYLLYEALARGYGREGAREARESLAFINRALFLRPLNPQGHLVAARALLELGRRKQAWLEYRLAYEGGAHGAVDEGVRHARGLDELRALVPSTPMAARGLSSVLRAHQRAPEAEAVLEWALQEFDGNRDPGQRTAVAELCLDRAALRLDQRDLAEAERLIEQAARLDPRSPAVVGARAELLARTERREEAIRVLQAAVPRYPEHLPLTLQLSQQLVAAGKPGHARDALRKAGPYVRSAEQRVSLLVAEAGTYEAETRYGMALQTYRVAARLRPNRPDLHFAAARMSEVLGRYSEAREAVMDGLRATGAPVEAQKDWLKRLDELETSKQAAHLRKTLEEPSLLVPAVGGPESSRADSAP